jgi:hypothetical protein
MIKEIKNQINTPLFGIVLFALFIMISQLQHYKVIP